ncbi:MAG: alpha/beta fold hydrolase [Alphaproteobacteria bacterium]|nr:alpha/beta fold hydrolase [Alphaproteobacteria bacterium]
MKDIPIITTRFNTKDGLELHGHLYEPARRTEKIIIHIHGLIGNFYENLFVDAIAREAVENGWALLSFNNRGAGIVTDFVKKRASICAYERIGGSVERFEDSFFDIDAAIRFAVRRGYREITLQGHSLGCQKAVYYCSKAKSKKVRGIIFLAPVDDVACAKTFLGKRIKASLKIAQQLAQSKKQVRLPAYMEFYPLMSAARFLDIASPESLAGSLLDYNGSMKLLRSLQVPVLAIFCEKDQYQPDSVRALDVLKATLPRCETKLISGGGHLFPKKEKILAKTVSTWLKERTVR